jgi:N-acyl-L-homoserine lactone synthetase
MEILFKPAIGNLITSDVIRAICQEKHFAPGDVLRKKGEHYREMYLITHGSVEVNLEVQNEPTKIVVSDLGSPIGEISFLRGSPATATVITKTPVGALVIDDHALGRLEHEAPTLSAQLLRHLAVTAEERTSYNLTFNPRPKVAGSTGSIAVHLCRNADMLESAKRLRYEVYCQELNRNSPYADHQKKIISDNLDSFGYTFIAVEDNEVIGTLRGNLSSEGPLGILEELYGMQSSPHHPKATGICTKFVVKKSKRKGPAATQLISAVVRFGMQNSIEECFIDCIPSLLHYYKAIGFTISGRMFFHRENGPSLPMRLDVVKHGNRLCRERGAHDDLKLYVKAQVIKLIDRMRNAVTKPTVQ